MFARDALAEELRPSDPADWAPRDLDKLIADPTKRWTFSLRTGHEEIGTADSLEELYREALASKAKTVKSGARRSTKPRLSKLTVK